jgi:hypothetical protein
LTWATSVSGTEAQIALGSLSETITGLTGDNNSANTLKISGAPQYAVLSDGHGHSATSDGSTAIDVSGWTLSSLMINTSAATVPDGNFILTATATEKDLDNDGSAKATVTEQVTVTPTAPTVVPVTVSGLQGTPIALNLGIATTNLTGDSNTLNSVTISSIPTGATLSNSNGALTFSGGSITFDATQLANGALNGLKITAANNANFTLHVSAQQKDADGDLSNVARGSEAVTLPGYLWGTAVIQEPNSHLFNPIGNFDSAANTGALLFGTSPSSGFNATSPSVTMNVGLFDPFVLPYRSGKQQIETSTTQIPFKYQVMMPVTATGPEAVAFYSTETNGVSTIYQSIVSETAGGPNGSLTIGAPTALEQNLSGGLNTLYTSYTNVNASAAQTSAMTSYSVAWGVYNGSTYQAQFQIFPTVGNASGVVTIESLSGLASATLAPAWEFRSAGGLSDHGASVPYASVLAVPDSTHAGRQDIQFQGYNANGSANADVAFLITPDLTNFLPGATNQITQPSNGASLLFTPNGVAGSGFSIGWSETVTDANGTHNQVEFAVFKPSGFASPANGGAFGSGTLISQTTFQVPDAQNIRIGSSSVGGASVEYLAYGDNNSTTVVEFDQAGHQIASITDTSHLGVTYNDFEIMGDGRIVLTYDDNTQYTADIFDLRQTGLNNPTLSTTSANYIAGTHFADSVTGANGVNNFYDFIGSPTATPTDSFTGGTGSFNEAVFTDARSNFTITLNGGTATVQSNDSAHGGTLDTSNVQALAFGASHDPSPSSTGGLEVTNGETLVMLGNFANNNTYPVTIDTGGTLEIMSTGSAEAATFAATGATLQLDHSLGYAGTVSGFITGDTIDLTDITYSTTVTDIWNSANNTLTISNGAHSTTLTFAGSYTQDSFALKQDSGTGTEVVLTTVAHDDTIANASPPSGAGWVLDPANGHYYREVTTHGTFGAAVAGAAAEGGYLATITSAAEQAFVVKNVIGGLDATWLGGVTNNDRPDGTTANASTWTWITGPEAGTQFTYTNWNSGEPSGGFGATTQYLEIGPTGGWNDAPDAFQSGNGAGAGYLEEWGGLQNQIAFNENTGTTIAASVLLANDTDPNGGTLSITAVGAASAHGGTVSLVGNVITYTPTANYFGADSFTYTVSDGALTSTATVSFNVAPLAPVNLLANGGFETGNFSGWTVGGDNAPRSAVIGSGAHQATGDAPHHGSNEALIGGAESDVTLSHTVATAAGDHYTVDFWLANSAAATPGEGNDFSVSWNGVSLMSTTPNAGQSGYTEYQFDVVGAAGQSTLQFTALNENGFWNLDDVSVREGAPSTVRDVVDQTDPMAGVQSGDTLSVAANGNGYLGTLTAAPTAAGTFEWHFTATNNQLDHLTAQTQTYTVTDQTHSASQLVSVSIGGSGNDQFIFNANSNHPGADVMVNFSTASPGTTYVGDTIELDNFNGIGSVSDVLNHLSTDSHNNAVVNLGGGDSITFQGISAAVIQANAAHLFTFHIA